MKAFRYLIQTLRWLLLRNVLTYKIDPPWRKRPSFARLVQGRNFVEVGGNKEPKPLTEKGTMGKALQAIMSPLVDVKAQKTLIGPDLDKNSGGEYYKATGKTPPKKFSPTVGDLKKLQSRYAPHSGELKDECPIPVPEIAKSIIQIAEGLTGRRFAFMIPSLAGPTQVYLAISGKNITDPGRAFEVAVYEGYLRSGDEARTILIVKALKELLDAEQEKASKDKLGRIICDATTEYTGSDASQFYRATGHSATYFFSDGGGYRYLHGLNPGLGHKLKEIWVGGEESGARSVRPTRKTQTRLEGSSLEEEPDKTTSQDRLL